MVNYQIGDRWKFKDSDIPLALRNLIKGEAMSTPGGVITSQSVGFKNGHHAANYTIRFNYEGYEAYSLKSTIYSEGRFYTWLVQFIPAVSGHVGVEIFNRHVDDFQVSPGH